VIVGRGKVIADTSTRGLLAAASGDRVRLRTSAALEATAVLAPAGATVAADGSGTLTVSGLTAEQVVALLTAKTVPFSEVSAYHATLEQAYLELTRDAAEYRASDGVGRPAEPADRGAPRSSASSAATGREVAR
jgi:ABC-2 type transport system ATP-binding protein